MKYVFEINGSRLYLKSQQLKRLIYSDLMKTKLQVIGYADLSHEEEFWQPTEILIGSSDSSHGYITKLLCKDHNYQVALYMAAPTNVTDFIPVEADQELNHLSDSRAILVAGLGGYGGGLWLMGVSRAVCFPIIKSADFNRLRPAQAEIVRLLPDARAGKISLAFYKKPQHALPRPDLSHTHIDRSGRVMSGLECLCKQDITMLLMDHGINVSHSLSYNACYLREYL